MRCSPLVVMAAALAAVGCRGGTPGSGAPGGRTSPAPAKAPPDRNACHLLTHEEVSALVERKVIMADQTEAGEHFSTCDWEDEAGRFVFGLTAYWSGGKQQWETWRMAQGLGDAALERAEGVKASEVVEQGLVPGLGDAAYFSELLPSLVLKGDTLFEMKLALVPKAKTKFSGLAGRLLAKVG
jgi:hypothetical protein